MQPRTTTFYLVRHAHAVWTTDEMRPLSERGRQDAVRVAALLAPLPIDVVTSSPYRRAVQTVAPLAEALGKPVLREPDLHERCLADPPPSAAAFTAAVKATWDDFTFRHPGGESNAAARARGSSVVTRLFSTYPGGHLVVGTHGNLLALILHAFDPTIDYTFWSSLSMPDVYRLTLPSDGSATITRLWSD